MKTARQLTFALLIAIVCIVLIGGIMLLSDPSGRVLQLYTDDLKGTFMKDFAPLAWLLIISVSGVGLVGIFTGKKYFPVLVVTEGIILLLWCIVFIAFISVSAITPLLFGIAGAAFILLGRLIKKQQKDVIEHHSTFIDPKQATHSSSHPKSHYHKHRKRGH